MSGQLIAVHALYHDDGTKSVGVRRHYRVSVPSMVRLSGLLQGYINQSTLLVRVWHNGWSVRPVEQSKEVQ